MGCNSSTSADTNRAHTNDSHVNNSPNNNQKTSVQNRNNNNIAVSSKNDNRTTVQTRNNNKEHDNTRASRNDDSSTNNQKTTLQNKHNNREEQQPANTQSNKVADSSNINQDTAVRNKNNNDYSNKDVPVAPKTTNESKRQDNKHIKDLKFSFDDFKAIDQHARQAPSSAEESVETLANYLTKPARNEVEKVRALYVWVCENITYDTDAFFGNLQSAVTKGEDVLKSKSSVCAGYASLFEKLCMAAGIKCKQISGYAKGYGHRPGQTISYDQKTNHAWNVVELERSWQFIETTWGAGHVDKNKQFVKKFEDFYFLTPPESFIFKHFPYMNGSIEESKQWQLLNNPISIEDYSKMIKPSNEALQYGVKFPTHPWDIFQVDKTSTITIASKPNVVVNVWCDMFDSNGSQCNEMVMVLKKDDSTYNVTLQPSRQGKYTLHINATIDSERNTRLIEYIVDCISVDTDFKPYPKNGGFYGPKKDFNQRGFDTSEMVKPFHVCKNGDFWIDVKTIDQPEITHSLFDADGNDLKTFALIEQTSNTVHVRARLTQKGYYKLSIFSKVEEKYSEALVLLIQNTKESSTEAPFPKTYTSTTKYKCRLIEPLVQDLPANTEVQFHFICSEFDKILVNKKSYPKDDGDVWKVTATTPESGNLSVSGKKSDDNSYTTVYGFVIKS